MKKKKYLINTILTGIILVTAIIILITAAVARLKDETPSIFGYTMHIVVTPSMEPEINVGDLAIAKKADISEAQESDYVVFVSPDPELRGITILHSIIAINETAEGRQLITSGIKEGAAADDYPVTEIIAIYKFKSAFLGKIVTFLSNTKNLIFIVVLLVALIVIIKYSKVVFKLLKEKISK